MNKPPTMPAAAIILNKNQRKPPLLDEDLDFLPVWGLRENQSDEHVYDGAIMLLHFDTYYWLLLFDWNWH